ncbi:MAG: polyprenyl synthetase family protein [Anaerolineae bacterium]
MIYELMLRGGEPNSSPDGHWGRVARLIREVLDEGDPGTAYRQQLLTVLDEWAEPDTDIPAINILPRLVYEANGGDSFLAAPVTAAWQLICMAAKLFDDVEDGQLRGDLSEGINLATGLLFLASLVLGDLSDRGVSVERVHALNQTLNRAMLRACAGQHADLAARRTGTTAIDPNTWLEIAQAKSGELLAWAAGAGALVAGANERALACYREYGSHLGVLLQVADDFNGVWGPGGPSAWPPRDSPCLSITPCRWLRARNEPACQGYSKGRAREMRSPKPRPGNG